MARTALFGIHDQGFLNFHKRLGEVLGYQVDTASTLDQMLERVKEKEYRVYIMDANLGFPDTPTIDPAAQIYRLIEERVEDGSVVFVGITANRKALEIGRESGMDVQDKLRFDLTKYLE